MEIAPGVHRIESDLGVRFMCQYLLVGSERSLLVDTGIAATPADVLGPYLQAAGVEPDLVLVTHADVDHSGGNRAIRERCPRALLLCHAADRRWIESNEALVRENYRWHEPYGFPPMSEEVQEAMRADAGGDAPVDVTLAGGETVRLAADWRVEILHLPGHTLGHLGVWDPRSRSAVIVDAVLSDGIYDRAGTKLIPPRYYDLEAVRATIRRLRALEPELLLTAHYPVLEREEAQRWLEHSLRFVDDVEQIVHKGISAGTTDLWELTRLVHDGLGPFPEFPNELGATVRAAAFGYTSSYTVTTSV
jgi:glyoxylase-like metal-dependent hydrolase (beta-lactamase superfamily II)